MQASNAKTITFSRSVHGMVYDVLHDIFNFMKHMAQLHEAWCKRYLTMAKATQTMYWACNVQVCHYCHFFVLVVNKLDTTLVTLETSYAGASFATVQLVRQFHRCWFSNSKLIDRLLSSGGALNWCVWRVFKCWIFQSK